MAFIQANFTNSIQVTWSDLLATVVDKQLALQYFSHDEGYAIFALDGNLTYFCYLFKPEFSSQNQFPSNYSKEQNDLDFQQFESTYKSISNKRILKQDLDGSQIVAPKPIELQTIPFRHSDGSTLMNVNGSVSGSVTNVWNGALDSGADWTLSGQGVASVSAAKSGTVGLDTGITSKNDLTVFDNGTNISIGSSYSALSFWMMPKAYPNRSDLRAYWKNSQGAVVGLSVKVENYTSNMDLNVWHKVTIPISDFNLNENVCQFVFRYEKKSGQHFYFDDIVLSMTGNLGQRSYYITPSGSQKWHVSKVSFVLTAPESSWNSTGFANGLALENGLLLRCVNTSSGDVSWNVNIKDNIELFGLMEVTNDVTFGDGYRTFSMSVSPPPASVILTEDKKLEIVVRDNLTGLAAFRAFTHLGIEEYDWIYD